MSDKKEGTIRARNRSKILKAAIRIFAQRGYDGTRISEIAEATGLPKTNVYYYFGSKNDLYRAVIDRLIRHWDDALGEIVQERDPKAALTAYIAAKLRYSRLHPLESRLFASEILRGGSFLTNEERAHIRAVTGEKVRVLETWIAEGKIRRVDPQHLLIMLWASTQFYADFEPVVLDALNTRSLKKSDYDDAAQCISNTVLYGVC